MAHMGEELLQIGYDASFASDDDWWVSISHSDVIIIHSPFVRSLVQIAFAKLMRKTVVALVWDRYPVIVNGRRYDRRLLRRVADFAEVIALKLADRHLVPSRDFLSDPSFGNAQYVPLWYPPECYPIDTTSSGLESRNELRILFAGQINETRGVEDSLNDLSRTLPGPFRLLIASHNRITSELLTDDRVSYVGPQSKDALVKLARTCDFGLISLAPGFDLPVFLQKHSIT